MKDNRRLKMPCLEGIPEEVLSQTIDPKKSDVPNIVAMTRDEADEELLDLYMEKRYLIAAVEFLKERLRK